MTPTIGIDLGMPDATRWSIYAGGYMFAWGVMIAMLLSDILTLLADVIGIPAQYWVIVFSSPIVFVGAGTWWFLIERPRHYTYRWGGLFGLLTAMLTALLWTGRFVSVWGVEMLAVRMVYLLAGVVFAIAGIAGLLLGVVFMYPRRRAAPTVSTGGAE